uniref:Uncharacterized protein n=1 Tax=Anguilla anguilla TaxID=7936 RepID=A0A0E9WQZ2_ANGAN
MENVAAGTSAESERRASSTIAGQRIDSLKKNRPRRFSFLFCELPNSLMMHHG